MRLAAILSVMMFVPALAMPQESSESRKSSKPPDKGDDVVVTGCVKGSVFESNETRKVDGTGSTSASIDYRMSGKKETVKELRSGHEGHLEEITGVLKSKLPGNDWTRGKQLGKSGIFVGGASPRPGAIQDMPPHLPVLEVKSSKHVADRCGV